MRLPSGVAVFIVTAFVSAAAAAQQKPAPPPPPPPAPTPPAAEAPARILEVPGGPVVVAPRTETVVTAQPPPPPPEAGPQPLGFESDVHCFGYLGPPDERFIARIHGAESIAEQIDYMTSDLLYIDGGHDKGLKAGDEFWLVTPEQMILHPVTGEEMGRFYQHRGRVVIETLEGRTASARVTTSCTDIPLGSYLKAFEPVPIPLARKTPAAVAGDPPSGKVRGRIVYTKDGIVAVGADHTVLVDLGIAHGIEPGDFLTIFRYAAGREYGVRPVGSYWVTIPPPEGVAIPRTYLGEIAILAVGDRWALGRVTDSYRLVQVGDEVELK